MQFKHPEFLYALFLLVIPIIVHLFQLRRFKKELFTNVEFLKRVQLQTRKSSQLKKWLTLLARMLALTAVVLAFAQPFMPHSEEATREKEVVVYIDNSFSMQQKGNQGELLKQAVQQLLQAFPQDESVIVMTNDRVFPQSTLSENLNDLLAIDYSTEDASLQTVLLKAGNLFSRRTDTRKQIIAISDFQQKNLPDQLNYNPETEINLIQLKGKNHVNFSVDSIYFSGTGIEASELSVRFSASREIEQTLPVSLYDGETLLAKSSVGFDKDTTAVTQFSIPDNTSDLKGRVVIEDNSLRFDNTAYFNIQKAEKIRVAVLNEKNEDGAFLKKIFSRDEFEFFEQTGDAADYNQLDAVDFIVLNELRRIPSGLDGILQKHIENGGNFALIPSDKADVSSYNALLLSLNAGQFAAYNQHEINIAEINFSHPLFTNVFDGRVTNFQYPRAEGSFDYTAPGSMVLAYNNGKNFLTGIGSNYVFSTALNEENTNFKRSPLVVPTFYNMAKQSLKLPELAYTIGRDNVISVPVELGKDEVLHLTGGEDNFIPEQRRYNSKVELQLRDLPFKAGTYLVTRSKEAVGHLSFNYDRSENQLEFGDLSRFADVNVSDDIGKFISAEISKNQISVLWKWFVIFALIFLLIEVLLLKFLK